MSDIDRRVSKLETTFAHLRGGAVVLAVVVLGFLGYANWYQIPQAVDDAVPEMVATSVAGVVPAAVSAKVASAVPQAVASKVSAIVPGAVSAAVPAAVKDAINTQHDNVLAAIDNSRLNIETQESEANSAVTELKHLVAKYKSNFSKYEDRIKRIETYVQEEKVHVLGELVCGVGRRFDVPLASSSTDDWVVFGINPQIFTKERGESGDNAIYSISLTISPTQSKMSWLVNFDVEINFSTDNKRNTWRSCDWNELVHRSRIQVVAIKIA